MVPRWQFLATFLRPVSVFAASHIVGHLEDGHIAAQQVFFPIVDTCLSYEDTAQQICAMVPRWRFLATFLHPVFSASCVQHISDLHAKFALRPHHVWKYGRHPMCSH